MGPDDIFLVSGSPDLRRKFIDLICCQIDREYLKKLLEYKYWVNCRNSILRSHFNKFQCDVYDEKIAEIGSFIIIKRLEMLKGIQDNFKLFFKDISGQNSDVKIVYDSLFYDVKYSINEGKNVFYTHLINARTRDLQFGYTSIGPHRENVKIFFDSHEAKIFCSQGQCRALSLALKLSVSDLLYKTGEEKLIFLIDDTVAELDSEKTDNFFPLIQNKGQIFIAVPKGKNSFLNSYHTISL